MARFTQERDYTAFLKHKLICCNKYQGSLSLAQTMPSGLLSVMQTGLVRLRQFNNYQPTPSQSPEVTLATYRGSNPLSSVDDNV
jgi:hypothetical protein